MAARTVLLAGATGVVGTQLLPLLNGAGHRVRTLSRSPERAARLAGQVWDVADFLRNRAS